MGGKRWTAEEKSVVLMWINPKTEECGRIDRTDAAIESKFDADIALIRDLQDDRRVRHAASLVAMDAVKDEKMSSDGGLIDYCDMVLRKAFFVGGWNNHPLAAKCRKAALEAAKEA